MICPICEENNSKVTNVRIDRSHGNKVYRRRYCKTCQENFTTYEVDAGKLAEIFEESFAGETLTQIMSILDKEFPTRAREKVW